MLIDEKKDAHRSSYRDFLRRGDVYDLAKIKASISREFYQASYEIEEVSVGNQDYKKGRIR